MTSLDAAMHLWFQKKLLCFWSIICPYTDFKKLHSRRQERTSKAEKALSNHPGEMWNEGKQVPMYTLSVSKFTSEVLRNLSYSESSILSQNSHGSTNHYSQANPTSFDKYGHSLANQSKTLGTFQGVNDKLGGVGSPLEGQLRAIKPSQLLISRKCPEPRSLLLL